MQGKTHMMIAAAVAAIIAPEYSLKNSLILTGTAIFSSLIPDMDHPNSKLNQKILPIKNKKFKILTYTLLGGVLIYFGIKSDNKAIGLLGVALILTGFSNHRGFTHSLLGLLLFSYIVRLCALKYKIKPVFTGFIIGYTSHIISDFITKEGINIFYPYKKYISAPFTIKTSGEGESVIFIGACSYTLYKVIKYIWIMLN